MMTFLELAHMLDATQLCLSCHCTHAGCYATVSVLSSHTCWMLRKCVCLVIAHVLDATQLCLSCHCTHAGCYASVSVLSLHTCWMLRNCVCLVIAQGWGGVGMMTFLELAHMLDATQLCLSCHFTHAGCYATVWSFLFRMKTRPNLLEALRQIGTKSQQCEKMVTKRRLFFGGWFQYTRIPS